MNTENKSGFKKYILVLLGVGVVLTLACAIAVIVVDPFFHYHAPLAGFPYEIDNQLSQNPGMAAHMD